MAALLAAGPLAALAQAPDPVPVQSRLMHLSLEQRQEIALARLVGPQISAPLYAPKDLPISLNLLSHVPYTPSQRNQGACGDCWQWAGTGVIEVAHDVQEGIFDRLSVQFLNSCQSSPGCCNGGWLGNVASFYASTKKFVIPWSNDNANFTSSSSGSCSQTPCGSITTTPQYPVKSITAGTVKTLGVGQAQAIANIKSVLNQNRAVAFAFFLPTTAAWNSFYSFWNNQDESTVWTNFYCGQATDSGDAGHEPLCVGYYDDSGANRYWILLNSWGTTAKRPNGLFRVAMALDYDCADAAGNSSIAWETLSVQFTQTNAAPAAFEPFANATASGGTSYAAGANLVNQTNAAGLCWFQAGPLTGAPLAIASGSLRYPGLAAAQGNKVSFGGSGQGARLTLPNPVTSGTMYYSFLLNVTNTSSLGTGIAFWAGFNNAVGSQTTLPSVVGTRFYTKTNSVLGGFVIGVAKNDSTAANIVWEDPNTVHHLDNETNFIVGSYQIINGLAGSDDVSQLWINPDASTFGSDPAPAATLTATNGSDISGSPAQIGSFALMNRVSVSLYGYIDELRVGASWGSVTPSSGACTLTMGTVSANNVTGCYGASNGSITINASGGVSPLQFSVNGGSSWQSGTSPYTFSNLPAGSYVVQVRDFNLCLVRYSGNPITITQPPALSIGPVTSTDATCYGCANGSITVTASGGTGALQFSDDGGSSWSSGASPYTFANLAAGSYSIRARDANSCAAGYSANPVVLTQPAPVPLTIPSPPRYDIANGTYSVTFVGTPDYAYTIQWAPAVTGAWSFLKMATSGPDGRFDLQDTAWPALPERYYRVRSP